MAFAHEMDDGNSVYTATDTSSQRNGSKDDESMNLDNDDEPENDRETSSIDGNFSLNNDDAPNNLVESFDGNGSGDDDTIIPTDNLETIFNTSDENMVVVETIEYKPDFGTGGESSKSSENNIEYESKGQVGGKETVVTKNNELASTNVKIVKVSVYPNRELCQKNGV